VVDGGVILGNEGEFSMWDLLDVYDLEGQSY